MKHSSLFDADAWVAKDFKRPPQPVSIVTLPTPKPKVDKTRKKAPTLSTPERPLFEARESAGIPASAHGIIKGVARVSGFPVEAMLGTGRRDELVFARQIAAWLARNFTSRSLTGLGSVFKRDHTTILHAVRKIDRMVSERGLRPPEDTLEGWAQMLLDEHQADRDRRAEAQRKRARRNGQSWRARKANGTPIERHPRVWRKRYESLEEFKTQRIRRFRDWRRVNKDAPDFKARARKYLLAWKRRREELGL